MSKYIGEYSNFYKNKVHCFETKCPHVYKIA